MTDELNIDWTGAQVRWENEVDKKKKSQCQTPRQPGEKEDKTGGLISDWTGAKVR